MEEGSGAGVEALENGANKGFSLAWGDTSPQASYWNSLEGCLEICGDGGPKCSLGIHCPLLTKYHQLCLL
jgi:hypothetical protein